MWMKEELQSTNKCLWVCVGEWGLVVESRRERSYRLLKGRKIEHIEHLQPFAKDLFWDLKKHFRITMFISSIVQKTR